MDDLQVKLHSALGVAHQVLCELLSTFSLQHKDAKSDDPGVALANIFRENSDVLQDVHALTYKCNIDKIYVSGTKTISAKIIITELDITLINDILTAVDGFITIKAKYRKHFPCQGNTHAPNTNCCPSCDHRCPDCVRKKCERNSCCMVVGRCNHMCKNCPKTRVECDNVNTVCCIKCNICMNCTSKSSFCDSLKVRQAIEIITNLRNASSHVTPDECKKFRNGNWAFKEFPGEKDWESIWTKLDNAVQDCFDIGVKSISNERKNELLNDLKLTRKESVQFLERYFKDHISKQQEFIIELSDIQTQLGEIRASSQQRHNESMKQISKICAFQDGTLINFLELNKKSTSTQAVETGQQNHDFSCQNKNTGNVFPYRMFII